MVLTRRQRELLAKRPASEPNPALVHLDAVPGTSKSEVKSSHSVASTSRRSTASSIARRKLLELEAAEAKARIQMELIDKRLEADLAAADAEDQEQSGSDHTSLKEVNDRVSNWLTQGQEQREPQEPQDQHVDEYRPPVNPKPAEPDGDRAAPTQHVDTASSILDLANTLKSMIDQSSSQREERLLSRLATPRDLPVFSGDSSIEWLHFKSAYDESVSSCSFTEYENLSRLRRALRGEAKEAVTDLLIGNTSSIVVMDTLALKYGRPETIICNITSQLRKLQPLPIYYQQDLVNFATKVNNCVATIRALKQSDHLRNPELASAVISKLPSTLMGKWTEYAYEKILAGESKLELLAQFLRKEAEMTLVTGAVQPREIRKPAPTEPFKRADDKNRHLRPILTTMRTENNMCLFCKKGAHVLPECRAFKRAMRRDKWKYVKTQRLCFKCLIARHDINTCQASVCDIEECGLNHHRLLHWNRTTSTTASHVETTSEPPPSPAAPNAPPPPRAAAADAADADADRATVAHLATPGTSVTSEPEGDILLKVVPVRLRGPNREIDTYALLDDAASVSIIDSDLADELGLKCESSSAVRFVDAFGLEVFQSDAPKVRSKIMGLDNSVYDISLRKVSKLNLPPQNLSPVNQITCDKLSKLKNIVCNKRVVPRLLIGEDNYYVIAPLEIIHGGKNAPYASRCRLGWCIHGYCGRAHSFMPQVSHNICHLAHSNDGIDSTAKDIKALNELVKQSYDIDSLGISTVCRENTAHQRAIQILDETARLVDNRWEVGLPFKQENFTMPDTYNHALSRMQSLLRKFQHDRVYADRYQQEINKLLAEGYAREVRDNEPSVKHIWYLPHFGVQNVNKPGKLRLVFDSSAKVQNMCLNDYLLTGPDLYNSLLGIMLRFRENEFILIGDIKDMFLRVKIRQEDQHVFRFLWQASSTTPLKIYVMESLPFGATASPCIAQYIKNKNALRYDDQYPEAVQVILNSHYMDDCYYSTTSEQNAIKLIKEITYIHKQGGFEIRGWSSNSRQVLNAIPTEALAQSAVRFKDGATNMTERALGLMYHPADDTFSIKVSTDQISPEILNGSVPPTKAKMLSIIMSIYDIHGFLSPFIIKSKILFQDVHRSGIDWTSCIRPEEHTHWMEWLDELKQLQSLRIPRWYLRAAAWTPCYDFPCTSSSCEKIIDTQMHIFCDASIKAYATVIYWRFTRADGSVLVSFAASKSRVSSLRPVSVPRLELQGALLGARLAKTVITEQKDVQPCKRYYWTDSSTVLQWIRSDPRSYKPYVGHRLGEIDELTNINDWRYVPSSLNIADVATKTESSPLKYDDAWFQGPAFLRQTENHWPKDLKNAKIVEEATCEQRNINVICTQKMDLPVPDEERFSSWIRLVRTAARVIYFIKICKQRCKERKMEKGKGKSKAGKNDTVQLDCEIMRTAEKYIIKKCQEDTFAAEITCLVRGQPLSTSSRLLKLTPYLDDDRILRVGGRIDQVAGVQMATTRPPILDGKHKITRLLVEHYHRRAMHTAHEYVVNELRQSYWIVNLRPTVRGVAARCLFCRYRRARPQPQRMGDLPAARLQHNRRPFSFTGCDFFGPIETTIGRGRQKGYGMLFTCLTVRAIHIEITESLSTDSAIMALRRMSARRGAPLVIFSDNGTNLRGAANELKKSLEELNIDRLRDDGAVRGIEWRFVPPAAPEMAGAWERMIRTVKVALKVILKERAPHPETLSTLMAEVEALVNSRPITHVSTDPAYPEALTPNHFLIGNSSTGPAFGKYDDADLCLRKRWRIAQRLTDMFWVRWTKEYLPTLLPRQKWTKEARSLQVGDYVVLVDPNLERGSWRHGVVSAVHAGRDNRVRVVDVRTRSGMLRRPATRVALLSPADG